MTPSSMFSPCKHQDKEWLREIIDWIELLVKIKTPYALDLAEAFGEDYVNLQKKIATHDYTSEDESFNRFDLT